MGGSRDADDLTKGINMLVLSRKRDEQIVINGNIRITVVQIRGDTVRIGVDAPKETTVHRREVHERILRNQESGGET